MIINIYAHEGRVFVEAESEDDLAAFPKATDKVWESNADDADGNRTELWSFENLGPMLGGEDRK